MYYCYIVHNCSSRLLLRIYLIGTLPTSCKPYCRCILQCCWSEMSTTVGDDNLYQAAYIHTGLSYIDQYYCQRHRGVWNSVYMRVYNEWMNEWISKWIAYFGKVCVYIYIYIHVYIYICVVVHDEHLCCSVYWYWIKPWFVILAPCSG